MMPPAMGNCDCKVIGINQDGMHLGLTVVINALTITGGKIILSPAGHSRKPEAVSMYILPAQETAFLSPMSKSVITLQ